MNLIRQEMIKVRGQIAGIARLLVDEDQRINCMILMFLDYFFKLINTDYLQTLQNIFLRLLLKKGTLFTMSYPILFQPCPTLKI